MRPTKYRASLYNQLSNRKLLKSFLITCPNLADTGIFRIFAPAIERTALCALLGSSIKTYTGYKRWQAPVINKDPENGCMRKMLLEGKKIRLGDFFATWCQPCKAMHPILEQVKNVLSDRIRIIKGDMDKYGV